MIRDYEGFETEALQATEGGEIEFQALVDALSPEHRPQAFSGLKEAVRRGVLVRQVRRSEGTGRMTLFVSQVGGA